MTLLEREKVLIIEVIHKGLNRKRRTQKTTIPILGVFNSIITMEVALEV